jgi:phthiocerol/phenolphthiocerol synthesis type-I polyketide synthase E
VIGDGDGGLAAVTAGRHQTAQERDALLSTLIDVVRQQDPSNPLIATYVRGVPDGPYTSRSVWAIVADNASRDILLTDIFTASAALAVEIALQPVTTPGSGPSAARH